MARSESGSKLTPKKITEAALILIEKRGFEDFSMRTLATRLKIQPMSLYHHFPNKLDLLNSVLDHILGDFQFLRSEYPWEERLKFAAREWRRIAVTYPCFFSFLANHRLNTEIGLSVQNSILEIFFATNLPTERCARYFKAFTSFLLGHGLSDAGRGLNAHSTSRPLDPDEERSRFPYAYMVSDYFEKEHSEKTFNIGLEVFIEAIRREVKEPKGAPHLLAENLLNDMHAP